MLHAILKLVILSPYVFLPALLLFSRPGDGRNLRRAFIGGTSLVYGIFILAWVPLIFVFVTFVGWAFPGKTPDRGSTIAVFTNWWALSTYALGILFIATGVGVLREKRWGRVAGLACLVGFTLFVFFARH